MPDVLIAEQVTGPAIDRLAAAFAVEYAPHMWRSPAELLTAIRDVRALIVRNQTQVTDAVLSAGRRLEIVARAGVGLDNIDVAAAAAAGIVVTATPAANAVSVAELTLAFLLALARPIIDADADAKSGGWGRQQFTGTELCGKTLGLIGFGRIGQLAARRAAAFEMRVVAHDPAAAELAAAAQAQQVQLLSLDAVLAEADYVSLHLPLGATTRGLLGRDQFERIKPGAALINTSRGEIVDEWALLAALESGRLRAAALDVRAVEPPHAGRLEKLPNVILTPHIGAFTREAQDRVTSDVARDVLAVLSGKPAVDFVNFARPRRPGASEKN